MTKVAALEQTRSEVETTAFSPDRVDDAAELGVVHDSWQFSQGWRPLPKDDHNLTVAAWLEVCDDAGMKREHYKPCYRAAMQRRAELKAEGKELMPLAADDLVAEFTKLRKLNNEISTFKLLPEIAAAGCKHCFGVMPHARFCKHESSVLADDDPLLSEDEATRAAAQAEQAKVIQEGIRNLGFTKAIDRQLKCSNPDCGYTCNTSQGYAAGQLCTLGACMGVLKVIQIDSDVTT